MLLRRLLNIRLLFLRALRGQATHGKAWSLCGACFRQARCSLFISFSLRRSLCCSVFESCVIGPAVCQPLISYFQFQVKLASPIQSLSLRILESFYMLTITPKLSSKVSKCQKEPKVHTASPYHTFYLHMNLISSVVPRLFLQYHAACRAGRLTQTLVLMYSPSLPSSTRLCLHYC